MVLLNLGNIGMLIKGKWNMGLIGVWKFFDV
jgi:hypothetical protein